MSRTWEIEEVPQNFNEEGNPIIIEEGFKTGASNATTLENLMRQLEKLTAENKKLRAKAKKQEDKRKLFLKRRRRLLIRRGCLQKGDERKKKSR
jgi:hypothetical protein